MASLSLPVHGLVLRQTDRHAWSEPLHIWTVVACPCLAYYPSMRISGKSEIPLFSSRRIINGPDPRFAVRSDGPSHDASVFVIEIHRFSFIACSMSSSIR